MSYSAYNRLANRIVTQTQTASSLSASVPSSRPIIYDSDVSPNMQRVALRAVTQQARTVATIPKPTTKQPTLEEFDPLNPGGWQLGAGGKILPRLPEGTRVGKLVMGKYGLYDPKLRRQVEEYSAGLDAGLKSEEATPVHARHAKIAKVLAHFVGLIGIYNLITLAWGAPLPPYSGLKPPGSA